MSLQDEIYKKIKEEITNDPEGIGYSGKTDEEIKVLLNNSVVKQRIVDETYPSPMNRIMSGIANVPNIIETKDVTESKNVSIDVVSP